MSYDPHTEPRAVAIEQLEWFCLSTYAARTFVALCRLGTGTAKTVSDVSDVPRTRVYDAVDELQDRGLAEITQTTPQQFTAVSVETTRQTLDAETTERLSVLTAALTELEPTARQTEQRGVWTVTDSESVTERLITFISEADEQITYIADDTFFSEALSDSLAAAADRGVNVKIGGLSTHRVQELTAEIPSLTEAETEANTDVLSAISRLLIVDGSKTLISIRKDNPGTERAIWGVGESNGLVAVLTSLFGPNS